MIRTLFGSLFSLSFTSLVAYAMSRKELKFRGFFQIFNLITMFFGGGLIPYFALINFLGLYDNFLVYFIPSLYSVYNMIIITGGYASVSEEMHDSAVIDGAGELRIWLQIYFPLSKAVHATVLIVAGGRKLERLLRNHEYTPAAVRCQLCCPILLHGSAQ